MKLEDPVFASGTFWCIAYALAMLSAAICIDGFGFIGIVSCFVLVAIGLAILPIDIKDQLEARR